MPPDRSPDDPLANHYFGALFRLAQEWVENAVPTCLPRPRSTALRRALHYLLEHLEDDPSAAEVARAGSMSERTMARHLRNECGTSFRVVRHSARMMRAMELLLRPEASVTEVCMALGYDSLGSFSSAFRQYAGASPYKWRQSQRGPPREA